MNSSKSNFAHSIIILVYVFAVVFTPNFRALDSNGPKFFVLSLINAFVFLYLFTNKKIAIDQQLSLNLFHSRVGFIYFLFLLIAVISFTKAINFSETILSGSKLVTIFFASNFIAIVLRNSKTNISQLALLMGVLTLIDCILVFLDIHKYIHYKIPNILAITAGYSHKNILTAAIFVKIPFALWLLTVEKSTKRIFGFIVFFAASSSVLFLSSRTFYIGIILLMLFYISFLIVKIVRTKQNYYRWLVLQILILCFLSYLSFSVTQKYLYPKTNSGFDIYNNDVLKRLETIEKEPGGERISSWKRTIALIKKEPLLGVGLGNWKINSLKEANLKNENFIYQQKNHNDFLEITSEIGIMGGVLYWLIVVLILVGFIKFNYFHTKNNGEVAKLFLPAFGIFAYGIDAFFNFPLDRPEIGTLFAFYIGIAISENERKSFSFFESLNKLLGHFKLIKYFLILFIVTVLFFCSYLLYLNLCSLKVQRIVYEEFSKGQYNHTSEFIIKNYNAIPNITAYGEPVIVNEARYLLNEKKYMEAITILKKNNPSPYDTRREYFIALSYYYLERFDSAMFYANLVSVQKPYLYDNVELKSIIYEKQNLLELSLRQNTEFLKHIKINRNAWLRSVYLYGKLDKMEIAVKRIDSAAIYLNRDTVIRNEKNRLHQKLLVQANKEIYKVAIDFYAKNNFSKAVEYFTEYLRKVPLAKEALEYRAFSYAKVNEREKSNKDIEQLIKMGIIKGRYYNLVGANNYSLGNIDSACSCFFKGMNLNDEDARNNYKKFCSKK